MHGIQVVGMFVGLAVASRAAKRDGFLRMRGSGYLSVAGVVVVRLNE